MQKILLLLLFAALFTPMASAQTNSLHAKWTDDQKVVLESLPAMNQTVFLPLRKSITQNAQELKNTSEKMSNDIAQWKITDDGSGFTITLGREQYPQWSAKDWELYINRVMSAYFPKG